MTRSDGYDAAAASMPRGETAAAAASLQPLSLEWGSRHATNLGSLEAWAVERS
jgi:hypothetical protein